MYPLAPRSATTGPGRSRWLVAALGVLVLLAGGAAADALVVSPATAAGEAGPSPSASSSVPRPDHVVVVLLENKHRSSVMGSSSAPYLNELAGRGANMSQSYGVTHPSQGNYVALFSGDQHGVNDDRCPVDLGSKENLGSQLQEAGLSFTGYAESLPYAGYEGCDRGRYRRKHNPWVDFANLGPEVNQPFSAFPTDYAQLPTVSFVVPNMCNDMHDCSVATGDAWLEKNLDGYARWATTHNSLLVVTFDENAGGTVNQIPTVLVGEHVRPGLYPERMNHYTLLRTLQDAYGLAPLQRSADVPALQSVWTTSSTRPQPEPPTGIINGTFESKWEGWVRSGSTYSSVIHHHQGARSGRAGAPEPTRGDSILSQTVTVPEGRSRLDVWWQGHCADQVDKAWATVRLKDNTAGTLSTLLAPTCVYTQTWRQVGTAVTPGHSYTIQLVNHDDGDAGATNRTYFDDVTLR
jgi:hypothetical protein